MGAAGTRQRIVMWLNGEWELAERPMIRAG
jgi:hypothetical protein